jgi:hypothetical protein
LRSKKCELLAHLNHEKIVFLINKNWPKNLKNTRQRPSRYCQTALNRLLETVFREKRSFFRYEIGILFNIKMCKQLLFFAIHFFNPYPTNNQPTQFGRRTVRSPATTRASELSPDNKNLLG